MKTLLRRTVLGIPVWMVAALVAATTALAIFAIIVSVTVQGNAADEPSIDYSAWDCSHRAVSDDLGTVTILNNNTLTPTFQFDGYSDTSQFECTLSINNLDLVDAVQVDCDASALAAAPVNVDLTDCGGLLDPDEVRTVILDKPGTGTRGELTVVVAEDDTLRIAAGLERYSIHPIARAIVSEAARRGIPLPAATEVREQIGRGISGRVDGREWRLSAGGPGRVVLEGDEGFSDRIVLADAVRPDSAQAVRRMRETGIEVVLLTGDHEQVASNIAEQAGITAFEARVDPEGKADRVRARQAEGTRVAFAGDGLNDGPALAAADVGIAMGTGAASSVLVADGVISTWSLMPLVAGFRASSAAARAIRWNQARSIGYNIVAVSAAAAGLINPLIAAILMPASSAMVIWGASRVEAAMESGQA